VVSEAIGAALWRGPRRRMQEAAEAILADPAATPEARDAASRAVATANHRGPILITAGFGPLVALVFLLLVSAAFASATTRAKIRPVFTFPSDPRLAPVRRQQLIMRLLRSPLIGAWTLMWTVIPALLLGAAVFGWQQFANPIEAVAQVLEAMLPQADLR
jgi:hypothetical protein